MKLSPRLTQFRQASAFKKLEAKLLEFYPPFFFMGAKVAKITSDYRSIRVELPLRWYSKNHNGTMFGGFICAISDPIAALLCSRIFAECEVWTQSHSVKFLRPGRTRLHFDIHITDQDLEQIRLGLETHHKMSHTFEFDFKDRHQKVIAHVSNTVFLRKLSHRKQRHHHQPAQPAARPE
jgi:acyl-coenzyme A thioesterase PaaI-like protein